METTIKPRGYRNAAIIKQKLRIETFELQYALNRIQNDAILAEGSNELQSAAMHLQLAISKINSYNAKLN